MAKKLVFALLFVSVALAIAACGAASTPAPAATSAPAAATTAPTKPAAPAITRGGTLRIGLNSDLTTMDPHLSTAAVDRQVYQSIYSPLVRLDKDLTLKPELAEKWEFTDPTTLVLNLRKGVKFHDGTDFNAKAVKVNFDRMLNPDTKSLRAAEISSVKEVVVVDDYTVKINLKAPSASLMAVLSDRAGMMISPAAIEKYGKDLARNPVGTGPFQFVEWVKDDHLSVKKFDGYWEKGADGQSLPYLDGVVYKPVTDATVKLTSLKTNTLDMIDGVAPKDVAALRGGKDLTYDEVPGLGYQAIDLNLAKPPFDKVEVRQAVAYAVDAAAITKNVLFGVANPGQGPIAPSSWAYDPSINLYKRDIAKAKELIAKAGLTAPVKFPCMIVNSPESKLIGEALKEELAEAGFDMEIQLLEFGTALAKATAKDYTCFQIGWSGRPDPDGNTYSFLFSVGPNNTVNYVNPKVDELLDKARASYDQAQRKATYTELIKMAVNDVPRVYLWWGLDIKVWSPKVNLYVHVPDGMMRTKEMWLAK
ncbi:MAG: peptide ABC transporter substrate-binding protein [Chloroflexi bacterium]|nr:peptide ABC transporter substrate-binding protein [Chloroflexota bacterium]MBI3733251.1 peptide ABC transporter substrate-binding protein [Chloroflexota bacterium]